MERFINLTTKENLHSKFYFANQTADIEDIEDIEDIKDVKEVGPAIAREPDFVQLHALYEIEYEQFLMDTNHEIAKYTQRLLELESIVYGSPSSERVP